MVGGSSRMSPTETPLPDTEGRPAACVASWTVLRGTGIVVLDDGCALALARLSNASLGLSLDLLFAVSLPLSGPLSAGGGSCGTGPPAGTVALPAISAPGDSITGAGGGDCAGWPGISAGA